MSKRPDSFIVLHVATLPKQLKNGFFYHVYNRGVEKRKIFLDNSYYQRFLTTLNHYQFEQKIRLSIFLTSPKEERERLNPAEQIRSKLVQVLCLCLMPNHFHLVLKQLVEGGISKFMNDISNSYARYFNTRTRRVGPLFQGRFKAKLIDSQESFLQVTRYIHLNPLELHPVGVKAERARFLRNYPYSSYQVFLNQAKIFGPSQNREIQPLINSAQSYREFVESKIGGDPSSGIEPLILE